MCMSERDSVCVRERNIVCECVCVGVFEHVCVSLFAFSKLKSPSRGLGWRCVEKSPPVHIYWLKQTTLLCHVYSHYINPHWGFMSERERNFLRKKVRGH